MEAEEKLSATMILVSFLGTGPLLKSHLQKRLHCGLSRKRGVLGLSWAA